MLGAQVNVALGTRKTLAILGDVANNLTAAGTNQATALALTAATNIFTTVASGTGGILPSGGVNDRIHVANLGANELACYPPVGGKLNGKTANYPALIPTGKTADFVCLDTVNYTVLFSA